MAGRYTLMNEKTMSYYRPADSSALERALHEAGKPFWFLAGGSFNLREIPAECDLIDLQDLGWDDISQDPHSWKLGGLASLSAVGQALALWSDFQEALAIEAGLNVRNSLSMANWLRQAGGRSALLTCLRAFQPQVQLFPGDQLVSLEALLKTPRVWQAQVVRAIHFAPVRSFAFESVGRSPRDLPIVCVAAARTERGVSVSVGGADMLLDPFEITDAWDSGLDTIRQVCHGAADAWASAEYRQDTAAHLLSRCLQKIQHSVS